MAIHTGGSHYLDHLGVIAILLHIPLLVTDEETFEISKKFYPELSVHLIAPKELSLFYLSNHFDLIFESGHFWTSEILPFLELLYEKKMRMIYCPHGNSDKKSFFSEAAPKDISLVYGNHMINHLQNSGELSKLQAYIITGNYRLLYYVQRKRFYDLLLDQYLSKTMIPDRKTLLYAPSWLTRSNDSVFYYNCLRIIEEIGEYYNIIVRWHPFLEETHLVYLEKLLLRYEGVKGISFLQKFPAIYPLLNRMDAYIGDNSSIGYDALSFNKPLYFLGDHSNLLTQCGVSLPEKEHLGSFIRAREDSSRMFDCRINSLYKHVFGERKEIAKIEKEIKEALSCERAFTKQIDYFRLFR